MDKNNNTLSEVRKTAAQRMWDAENKQRAKSDASNKRTPSSIPVPDKKLKSESATLAAAVIGGAALMRMHQKLKDKKAKQATEKPAKPVKEENVAEGATGAKPGWMLRQDPVLGSRVKAAQAKQKEFKKLVGTKVPVKPTPTQGVAEGYNDLGREYGGAYVKGRSDDARMTEKLTRQAKAAAAKAGKTFSTSAEYRMWHRKQKEKQGVAESGIPHSNTFGIKSRGINLKSFAKKDTLVATLHSSKEKEANEFAKKHNYIVKKHAYVDPYSKEEKHTFQVHKESVTEAKDPREYDYEGDMAKSQLRSIIANAQRAHDMLEDDTNMAEWVQSKITLAADYISTVADYMQSQVNEEAIIEAHTEYDIANGGTVIYKHDGKHYMAKVSHKTGGGAGTMIHTTSSLGHKIKLNQVVSTDASDWTKYKNIKEETEKIDELNKFTVYSYTANAEKDLDKKHKELTSQIKSNNPLSANKTADKIIKRYSGIARAETRLYKEETEQGVVEAHIASPLSAANANAEYKRQPSNTLKVDVKHLGGVSNHKAVKQHLTSKGITAGIGSSDNYHTVHLSNISHSHGEIKKKLGIKESKSFLDIRKELDERNLTPVEKIAREELSKMKYKKVRGAPTE